ncbi:HlyD family efflux transporter periplasmic adaptor subunit [Nitrospirillum sp. BR 11828]|uniref:HlyD family efflux transporter periplasmic adaptor subunit n=1 Tax=Nitrospirillum sp. BR 11828 TaxID=3104325 RepID=UPI002ACA83D1|nr:HlyD family efflux transporter periplasmic adaptor subunit [Nitrospirillum sp. BR 11828]MDZ5645843.1 HlyD family efflux transporter periplasmic adaptor subunit [Nitrospirillum sp. BR 11828]
MNPNSDRDKVDLYRKEAVDAATLKLGSPFKNIGINALIFTWFITASVIVIIAFLILGQFTRKETVQGIMQPIGGALKITMPRDAVVSEIYAKEGDFIEENSPILDINSDQTINGGDQLSEVLNASADAQKEALERQLETRSASLKDQKDTEIVKLKTIQSQQLRYKSDRQLQIKLIELREKSFKSALLLSEKGYFSEVQLREREGQLIEAQQGLSRIDNQIEENESNIKQIKLQIKKLEDDYEDMTSQLSISKAEITQKQANNQAQGSGTITSPVKGKIVYLHAKSGDSIHQGAIVAIIMPNNSELEAELWAPSKAIGFIKVNDEVRVMYDPFPYQRFGVGHGKVSALSTAPVPPNEIPIPLDTKESMYKIEVKIDKQYIEAYQKRWDISPGTKVTADITTGSQSFIEWILDPILAVRRRSE